MISKKNITYERLAKYIEIFNEELSLLNIFEESSSFKAIYDYFLLDEQTMGNATKTDEFYKTHLFIKKMKQNNFEVITNPRQFLFKKSKKNKDYKISIFSQVDVITQSNKSLSTTFKYESDSESFYFEKKDNVFFINPYENILIYDDVINNIKENFSIIGVMIKKDTYDFHYVIKEYNAAGTIYVDCLNKSLKCINFFDIDFSFEQNYNDLKLCLNTLYDDLALNYLF